MIKIVELIQYIESIAPVSLQESYDNSGLLVGDKNNFIASALICLDCTEEVLDEAIEKGCGLIISHHPFIFSGLKKITGDNYIQRILIKAIKNDIAIYSAHTNLDNIKNGVNGYLADVLGLESIEIMMPMRQQLRKLVAFCPVSHADIVRNAICEAGAGHIGDYDTCTFNLNGNGTFRALEGANPFVGEKGAIHSEPEVRVESIFPKHLESKIIKALISSHPYEEPAYDVYALENTYSQAGSGVIGVLDQPLEEKDFLKKIKDIFNCESIRCSTLLGKPIKKVAICGGSGSFLIDKAIAMRADVLITGDIKYHQFFDADKKLLIADVGHYESEHHTKNLLNNLIIKKFPNFAVRISEIEKNPVVYF